MFKPLQKIKATIALTALLTTILPYNVLAQGATTETGEVRDLLGSYHVSGVSKESLDGKSIQEMVGSLKDPYTVYFTKKDLEQFQNSLENNYVGIGARVGQDEAGLYVAEVFHGSPAEASGVQRGDYIQAVDAVPVSGKTMDAVISTIVGDAGTKVKVTVLRGGTSIDLNIIRNQVHIPVVTSKLFSEGTGYIQVTGFSSEADEEFSARLQDLKKQGLKSLIIDLRNNPGGLLDTAVNIAKNFIPEGTLIHTKDRNNVDEPVLITKGTTLPVPVVILLNENSASASEVLSGALQDYHIAKVVGTKSYGKGSVQNLFPLSGGGALKVTIEEYLTPKLHKVNKVGINPDVPIEGEAAQMITALHTAGVHEVSLTSSKHSLELNHVEVGDGFKLLREQGYVYAPSRALAALIDSKITWDDTQKAVQISAGNSTETFPMSPELLIVQNGTSYVNLEAFAAKFPKLHWTSSGDQVTINSSEEN